MFLQFLGYNLDVRLDLAVVSLDLLSLVCSSAEQSLKAFAFRRVGFEVCDQLAESVSYYI